MPTGSVFISSSKVMSSGQRKLFQFSVKMMTAAAIAGLRASGSAMRKKILNAPGAVDDRRFLQLAREGQEELPEDVDGEARWRSVGRISAL